MRLTERLKHWRKQRVEAWLARRIPAASSLTLNRKNLFILPTAFGWSFLLTLVTLLTIGTNYQNNLILALSLWLLALWLLCLILCHQNLSGSLLQLRYTAEGQCDQPLRLLLALDKTADKRALAVVGQLSAWQGPQASEYSAGCLAIDITVSQRGHWPLPRIDISSVYPLGLFRCWTRVDFNATITAYPVPLAGFPCPVAELAGEHDVEQLSTGPQPNEFSGLKAYRSGERKSLLAWKQFAAGRGLQSKEFSDNPALELQLTDRALVHLPYEQSLSVLVFWVRQLNQQQQAFSFQLAQRRLASASGNEHLQAALRMLAGAEVP
ncbi:hypothetical protein [Agarivorans sp. QJM3NY_25]|uniref:hypothetical protein n=1 Tax=Agarivorans sp. QJM3NY_25 TaxID=3421430 RepID=UPI003D7CC4B3